MRQSLGLAAAEVITRMAPARLRAFSTWQHQVGGAAGRSLCGTLRVLRAGVAAAPIAGAIGNGYSRVRPTLRAPVLNSRSAASLCGGGVRSRRPFAGVHNGHAARR